MAKLKWQLLASLIAISVSGAVISTDAKTGPSSSVLAQLVGFTYNQSELHFVVMSNGCTTAADFILEFEDEHKQVGRRAVLEDLNETIYLRLVRIKADVCRRRPATHEISIPVSEVVKGRKIRLTNTFVSTTQLKRE